MTVAPGGAVRRRWRAPEEDGAALLSPSLTDFAARLAPPSALVRSSCTIAGLPLAEFAASARRDLVTQAAQFSGLPLPAGDAAARPLVLSGHQPALFHAGVWLKNFALAALAQNSRVLAVNLAVDNDLCPAPVVLAPMAEDDGPPILGVPFDAPAALIPWEERPLLDRDLWRSFPARLTQVLRPFHGAWAGHRPLAADFPQRAAWRAALETRGESPLLGLTISALRRELERRHGVANLELPVSAVARSHSFRLFVRKLLLDLPRFSACYNAALGDYRRLNRVRSRAHPAPDLETRGDWREAPLWMWSVENPARRRLFVRRSDNRIELGDHNAWQAALPTAAEGWLAGCEQLEAAGFKLRPRALLTTLYARLVLCDGFIHGIGGAKYDDVTDALFAGYLGLPPPPILVATATLRLPIARPQVTPQDISAWRRQHRDLVHHPERFAARAPDSAQGEFAELAADKSKLLDQIEQPRGLASKAQQRAIGVINRRLTALLAPVLAAHGQQLEQLSAACVRSRLLGSREFAFGLFPEAYLVGKLKALVGLT